MIKAPPVAVTTDNGHAAAERIEEVHGAKTEAAFRRLLADDDGRHLCKWLMELTDLEGMSGNPHREGQRSIGMQFKLVCDALGPGVYAGLVAELTADRAHAEVLRAKAASA